MIFAMRVKMDGYYSKGSRSWGREGDLSFISSWQLNKDRWAEDIYAVSWSRGEWFSDGWTMRRWVSRILGSW